MAVPTPARRTIDRFDRELLEHLLLWAPFGRPPRENCLPQFGIPAHRFEQRVREILAGYSDCALDALDRRLIADVFNVIERSSCARRRDL